MVLIEGNDEKEESFKSVLLPNAKIPPPTLKPEDFERNREWRPQIGMSPANQRASLDISGRKALNWHLPKGGAQFYNAVPPSYDSRSQGRNQYRNNSRSHYHSSYYEEERNMYNSYNANNSMHSRYSNHSRNSWAYLTETSRGSPQWTDPYRQQFSPYYSTQAHWDPRNQQYPEHRQPYSGAAGARYPNVHSTYYRR
ncbi:uncharacterized protein LOC111631925 [Centruroides sculpturatus]|uniref:uncharacterized protein LOC111631925 n=1 Tax=Centruroides sculpturatus TaxID=218467 RepID=UPI000C6DC2D0|nr:uncharacterized protein LOC111631925 [Centruroides sculpturatus]